MGLVAFLPPVRKDIPNEPGQWMEFRKPPGAVVREARSAIEKAGRQGVRDFGPEIVKAFTSGDDDAKAARRTRELERQSAYDPSMFDRPTLLGYALKAWSYDAVLPADDAAERGQILEKMLEEATAQWAHEQIVTMLKPPTSEDSKSAEGAGPRSA